MEKGINREKSLELKDYLNDGYFTKHQWESYLFQINAVRKLVSLQEKVLEIGCGGGIVRAVLERTGYTVETLDVNENLRPTYIGDISQKTFELINKYDCVICAEVLEHISIELFDVCLNNIKMITQRYVLLTIPNCRSNKFEMELSINNHRKKFSFGKKINEIAPMHYWELNYEKKCTNDVISEKIKQFFQILDEGVVMSNPYHYYYILRV